mgnify:CR=1 FL=1
MNTRIYHGEVSPDDFARDLFAQFDTETYSVEAFGNEDELSLQIATRRGSRSGGDTSISVHLLKVADGVSVQLGEQRFLGLAASFGRTALDAFRNPISLLGKLDRIAQDIESVQLEERVWKVIDRTARQHHAGEKLSQRLSSLACPYCQTGNKVGEGACLACGAPLGSVQPETCRRCGYVLYFDEASCPNCGLPSVKSGR